MEDHGQIITHFETLFGESIDHEVIKMVLQVCDWDSEEAYGKLSSLVDSSKQTGIKDSLDESTEFQTFATDSQSNHLCISHDIKPQSFGCLSSLSNYEAEFDNADKLEKIKKFITEKKKILIVMRGLPGSGKSTLAQSLNKNGIILSTDDYFFDKYKNYDFKPALLTEAHRWNKDRAKLNIFNGVSPIFIDNTNLQFWEFEPYIRFALDSGYDIEVLEPQTLWKYNCKDLSKKCLHNVSEKKIKEMKQRFERNLTTDQVLEKINNTNKCDDEFSFNMPLELMKINSNCSENYTIDSSDMIEQKPDENKTALHASENSSFLKDNCKIGQSKELADSMLTNNEMAKSGFENNSNEFADKHFDGRNKFKSSETTIETKHSISFGNINSKCQNHEKGNKENLDSFKNVDWDSVSPSNIDSCINWDSSSININQISEQESNLASKPPRNRRREEVRGSCLNDLKKDDDNYDFISLDPVESCLVSWEQEMSCRNRFDIPSMSHTGAVPKMPQNFQTSGFCNKKIVDKLVSPCLPLLPNNDNSTQYSTSDYSDSNVDSKIIEGNPSSFISGPPEEVKDNEPLTKSKLVLHKSSMTDDLNTFSVENHCALERLISFFPSVSKPELEDVFEKCDFDLDWATNLLIDGGYEIAASLDEVLLDSNKEERELTENTQQLSEVEKQSGISLESFNSKNEIDFQSDNSNSKKVSDHCMGKKLLEKTKHVESFDSLQTVEGRIRRLTQKDDLQGNINKMKNKKFGVQGSCSLNVVNTFVQKEINSEDANEENSHYLKIELSPLFAIQLINVFGPVGSLNLTSEITKEDFSVILPPEVSHQIYQCWIETLKAKYQHETDFTHTLKDEELARKLQEEEITRTEFDAFDKDPPTSLQEIINLEKALEISSIKSKNKPDSDLYSSVLSLRKLQEEFNHVDSKAVEKEYYNQATDYKTTKSVLGYKYGNSKSFPKTVLAPGIVTESNNSTKEPYLASYVTNEEDWDDSAITVEDPQAYRDEAQMHFLERNKAMQKAREASQQGMKSVAGYYVQVANVHLSKFKEANERASKKILNAVNSHRGPNMLDLHLLHVPEALRETRRFLAEKKKNLREKNLSDLEISIITGKGTHSLGREPRLKPAVGFFLKREGYSFHEYAGMFKVNLRSELKL